MPDTSMKAIILDDEPEAISNLEKFLVNFPQIQVIARITDALSAVSVISAMKPDLLFSDVQMPGKNGFEVAEELFEKGIKPDLIFVTAFDRFAIQAVRHTAFDYLLKPVNPDELKNAIDRLLSRTYKPDMEEQFKKLFEKTTSSKKLKISTAGGFTLIRPEDIIYIEADWNYADIYFSTNNKEMVTTNIGSLEEVLPASSFFRISRSVIINTTYLIKVNRKKRMAMLVKDGKEYSFKIPLLNIRKLENFLEKYR